MPQIFYRKKFSDYLGEPRALNDIIGLFTQEIVPTPTPTPSVTPTNTPTPSVTATITPSPSITPTNTVTPTITPTNTQTATPVASTTPTPTNTSTNTPTPTITPTNTQTPTPSTTTTLTPTPTQTQTPTNTITPTQTPTNTQTPSVTPTITPTNTQTPTNTPTPSSTPTTPLDPDATNYLNRVVASGGTLNPTISAATNTLFQQLKTSGLWNKLEIFYPMLGGNAGGQSQEGKGRTQFNISFVGTSHNYSGVTTAANDAQYGNTNFNPSLHATGMTDGSVHVSHYNGETGIGNGMIGTINAFGNGRLYILLNYGGSSQGVAANDGGILPNLGNIDTTGYWIATCTSQGQPYLYKNGAFYLSGTTSYASGLPNANIHVPGVSQSNGSNWGTSQQRVQFATVGQGLTDAEANDLSNIINEFEIATSRNVYTYNPSTISNLLWWNDYTDTTKTSVVSGRLSGITDSGNGQVYFTQDTASLRPPISTNVYNGLGGISGTSNSDIEYIQKTGSFTNPSELTMFHTFYITDTSNPPAGSNQIISSDSGAGLAYSGTSSRYISQQLYYDGQKLIFDVFFPNGGSTISFIPDYYTSAKYLYSANTLTTNAVTIKQSGSTVVADWWINGSKLYTVNVGSSTVYAAQQNIALCYKFFFGTMFEQMMYSRALTDTEIQELYTNYFNVKY